MRVLFDVRAHAGRHGIELRLVVCSRPVWLALKLAGLVDEFAIYRSRALALTEPLGAGAASDSR